MKIYRNKFTKEQLKLLNEIKNEDRRKRYMSIFSYILECSNDDRLEISLYSLEKKYNARKKRACLQTIKNAVKKFTDLGLLSLEKVNGNNIYVIEKSPQFLAEGKTPETIENTSIEADKNLHKSKYKNNIYNNIVLNTYVPTEEIDKTIKATMKEFNIKSSFVYVYVKNRLLNIKVQRAGLIALILKNMEIAKAYIETKRELFKRNVNLKKNKNIAKCNTELGNYTSNNSKRLKNLTYDPKRIKEIEELEAEYENALLAW